MEASNPRAAGCRLVVWTALVALAGSQMAAQVTNYVVGPQDVLIIAVFDDTSLGGKYAVEADGTFTFPLIGRIQAGGRTLREVEGELRDRLANGFFRNPQVTVAVEQYRSQRVFIVGEMRQPGSYSLTGQMTLIEALARAGSTTGDAGGEAIIVRPSVGASELDGPLLPGQDERSQVIKVDLKALQAGKVSDNVMLRDGDTIFVPRAELMYVFGQVKNPGAYPVQKDTTVLQALSLAGGVTDRGATGRIRVVRFMNGKKVEIRVKLDDTIRAGDTVMVPERFF